ncbi:response regulator [Herpetosiphon sp. NSE202]|uniref:response regulator n=1 Tax=Herpetosiphon sp. NSE202 TaxID=3351349 RepID=UPI0036353D9F
MSTTVVLYIEDNSDNMLLVERLLIARGCQMVKAINGSTGIELALEHTPHIILLDINLPDIDGYEVARRLRDNPITATIPIVAVTANALKGDAEKALAAGCDGYVSKPINLRDLWNAMLQFIQAPSA